MKSISDKTIDIIKNFQEDELIQAGLYVDAYASGWIKAMRYIHNYCEVLGGKTMDPKTFELVMENAHESWEQYKIHKNCKDKGESK